MLLLEPCHERRHAVSRSFVCAAVAVRRVDVMVIDRAGVSVGVGGASASAAAPGGAGRPGGRPIDRSGRHLAMRPPHGCCCVDRWPATCDATNELKNKNNNNNNNNSGNNSDDDGSFPPGIQL